MMSFDIKEFTKQYPSTQVIEQLCGLQPMRRASRYNTYLCPFHQDRQASLVAYHDGGVQCYAGCTIDNHTGHVSIIAFVMQLYNVNFKEAMRLITNEEYKSHEYPVAVTEKEKWTPDMRYVEKAARNLHRAMPYFSERGIPRWYAQQMKLGEKIHTVKGLKYKPLFGRLAGKLIDHFPVLRYSIPTFRSNPKPKVYSLSLRLNEDDAYERMQMIDPCILAGVHEDLLSRKGMTYDKLQSEILYSLFGPKYITLGSGQAIFNSELLARWDGTRWVYPHYEQLGVLESQFDAMILTLLGFPTVATKGNRYLKQAFQAVDELVIIRDNDEGGHNIADNLLLQSGRTIGTDARFLDPYPERKDVGEMYEANELCDWMWSHGLLQFERYKLA